MKWDLLLNSSKVMKSNTLKRRMMSIAPQKNNLIQIIELLLARAANASLVFTQWGNLNNCPSLRFYVKSILKKREKCVIFGNSEGSEILFIDFT